MTLTFGNQRALYMTAMTWWDHETESIWSQPWGTSIAGPLFDTALTLIPTSIVPWSTWLSEHPETTVLADQIERKPQTIVGGRDDFVIGVALGDSATAYRYELASRERVINDQVGLHPVAVFVEPETRNIKVYLRRPVGVSAGVSTPSELRFERDDDGRVIDVETGSVWNISCGTAIEGELKGALIQQIPYVSSYDWAWLDFFPHTAVYGEE